MRKTLLIAWQRIWQVIGKLSYWLGALMPLFSLVLAGAALGLTVWGTRGQKSEAPPAPDVVKVNLTPFAEAVGYVDQAGLLQKLPPDVPEGKFVPYPTETQAQAAIAAGDIVGYYVIPADYVQGGHAAYYAPHLTLFSGTDLAFREMLKANLVVADSEAAVMRAIHPPTILYRPADDAPRQVRGTYSFWQFGLGLALIALFMFVLSSIGPYWLGFMVAERERGMLEILLTSASPNQFLMGKLLAAAFLMAFESLLPVLSLALVNEGWRTVGPALADVSPRMGLLLREMPPIPFDRLWLALAALFLGLLVYSAVYTICGVLIQTPEAVGAVNMGLSGTLGLAGFILLISVLLDPSGPLAVGLSFFPLTAPVFLPVRLLLEQVPLWQTSLALAIMALAIVLCLRLAVHLFQLKRWWWGNT